ncbi:MAG TPA: RagB/SusD family nutrient uptake outer membrane protein [Flavobacteriaceae bacterium]|jgi:hypothetical protein
MKKIIYSVLVVASIAFSTSCSESAIDPTVSQNKDLESSINTQEDLKGILYGAYNRMTSSAYYGRDYIIFGEVRSDNAYSNANSNRFVTIGKMDLTAADGQASSGWNQPYAVIGSANIIISAENIEGDQALINHYKGQAYAIRALAHFDLLRVYGQQHVNGGTTPGGIPYVTTFRDESNYFPARNTVDEVYDLAMADLDMATSLMSASLNDASKVTITTHAVNAIKARIALYFGDMTTAATAAKAVIDSNAFQIAEAANFASTFSTDGASNSIFELAMSPTDNPGINGLANIYLQGSYGDIVGLQDLVDVFEAGDIRGGSDFIEVDGNGFIRNIGKYPSNTFDDNIGIFRYEEMILIYAEAILATNPANALLYLNMIPAKRGASAYLSATLDNILLERRKEFAFEGFRFDDLARNGRDIPLVDALRQTHGGVTYGAYNYAFPIPSGEVDVNSNVVQNKDY